MRTPFKVNRQIWGDKLKYVLEFGICHVISRMRNDDLALCLWEHWTWGMRQISRKPLEIEETWYQQTTNRKWPAANRMTDATNDVKWPWNVKVAWLSVRLVEPNISKMAGNRRNESNETPIGNGIWRIESQKLLLTAYRKSYMRNRLVPTWKTLLDLCLEVV